MTSSNGPLSRHKRDQSAPSPRLHNGMQVEYVATTSLKPHPDDPRRWSRADQRAARQIVGANDDVILPLLVKDDIVYVGGVILHAAKELQIVHLPVIRLEAMSDVRLQAMMVAYQRLGELGEFDRGQLAKLNLRFEAEIPDYQPENIGFEVGAIDLMMGEAAGDEVEEEEADLPTAEVPISRVSDLWLLGTHRIICGDSTKASTFAALMSGVVPASFVFSDPPFGCAIDGFVAGKGKHREFVMGSGELSRDELSVFFATFIKLMLPHLKAGSVVELVIDWRSLHLLLDAAVPLLGPLINLAVWVKDRPGQGGFLRSQHELVLIFKVGKGRFRNNVQLGRHGRNRTNTWSYPSAKTASKGSDEGDMLQHHPTPKPVRLVADAILDCTKRGEIVLDAFLGSGSTLIAAEKVGRRCHGVELDPLYVDLAIRRWQAWTGEKAVHEASGRLFDDIAAEVTANN